jgi:hypothetical protein|tara:strand:- start:270 stop:455 length:186 start_codon:yes stop_codon:yes gene_type:complete
MTNKINGIEAIARVAAFVCENPEIQPKDRRKVAAEMLEPMLNEIFGSEYEPYEEKENKNDH